MKRFSPSSWVSQSLLIHNLITQHTHDKYLSLTRLLICSSGLNLTVKGVLTAFFLSSPALQQQIFFRVFIAELALKSNLINSSWVLTLILWHGDPTWRCLLLFIRLLIPRHHRKWEACKKYRLFIMTYLPTISWGCRWNCDIHGFAWMPSMPTLLIVSVDIDHVWLHTVVSVKWPQDFDKHCLHICRLENAHISCPCWRSEYSLEFSN